MGAGEARDFFYKERAKGKGGTYVDTRKPAQWNAIFLSFYSLRWKFAERMDKVAIFVAFFCYFLFTDWRMWSDSMTSPLFVSLLKLPIQWTIIIF